MFGKNLIFYFRDISYNKIKNIYPNQISKTSFDSVVRLTGNDLECLPGNDLIPNSYVWFEGQSVPCDTRISFTAQFLDYSENSFSVVFSGALFRCSLPSANTVFSNVFDALTNNLIGNDTFFAWTSDKCDSFTVKMSYDSLLAYDSSIFLQEKVFEYYDRSTKSWVGNLKTRIFVRKPENLPAFKAKITGTSSKSFCDKFYVDGASSNLLGKKYNESVFFWKILHIYYPNIFKKI